MHTPLVELPASPRLHLAAQGKSVAQWLRLVPGHAPPGPGGSRRSDPLGWPAGALETQAAARFGHWQPVGTPTRWTMPSTVVSSRDQSIEAGDVYLHARAVPWGRGESHRFRHNKTRSRRSVPDPGVDEPRCDAVFPRAREPALPNLRMTPTKLLGNPSPSGLDGESPEAGMEEELLDAPSRGADSDEAANARTHMIPLWRKPIRVNWNWTTTSLCSRTVAAKTSLTCLPQHFVDHAALLPGWRPTLASPQSTRTRPIGSWTARRRVMRNCPRPPVLGSRLRETRGSSTGQECPRRQFPPSRDRHDFPSPHTWSPDTATR